MTKQPLPDEIIDGYLAPARQSAGVRRDLRRFLCGVNSKYTIVAAERLRGFDRPVLLVWGSEDKLFPLRLARQLVGMLPDARLVELPDAYTFIPEDQPEALVRHILDFAGAVVN